jgi:NADPH:quinone reductase
MSLRLLTHRMTPSAQTTTICRLTALTSQFNAPKFPPYHSTPSYVKNNTRKMSTSIPSTMAAILTPKTGPPSVFEYTTTQPIPTLQPGQILIKNTLAGINYIDTYFRSGLYPAPPGASTPMIVGQEAAGTVADANGHPDFKLGDRVVWLHSGGYAAYTAVPAEKTIKIPAGISDEDGLGAFLMGITAISLVQESHKVERGQWVLCHAAAGGMGLLMCQVLKRLGARMIGTAGGPEKCALAKENGAEFVIDYKAEKDWVGKVKEITGGEGVHVVYDSVGKDTWEGSLEVVRRKGSVVFFGSASGPPPPIPLPKLTAKNSKLCRPTMTNYTVTREELEYYANEVFSALQQGWLKVRVHKVYPLKDAREAHEDLEGRKTTGKLFLKL